MTNKGQGAAYVASLAAEELAAYRSDKMHRKAADVGRTFAELHFERRGKLGVERPNAGTWAVLHNGLYTALRDANQESDFTTPLLEGSDMSRPGITASQVLSSLYSVTASHLYNLKRYNGYEDNIAEFEKLLNLLAPVVAAIKPRKEISAATAAKTAKYAAREAEYGV